LSASSTITLRAERPGWVIDMDLRVAHDVAIVRFLPGKKAEE
jgi:hypothetical protein